MGKQQPARIALHPKIVKKFFCRKMRNGFPLKKRSRSFIFMPYLFREMAPAAFSSNPTSSNLLFLWRPLCPIFMGCRRNREEKFAFTFVTLLFNVVNIAFKFIFTPHPSNSCTTNSNRQCINRRAIKIAEYHSNCT